MEVHLGSDRKTALAYPEAELVIGLVAPVGTDLKFYGDAIESVLKEVGYSLDRIRLSGLIRAMKDEKLFEGDLVEKPYSRYLKTFMDAGDQIRASSGLPDVLALAAIHEIHKKRNGEPAAKEPLPRRAHLLWSLKRPEEVQTLRRVYGPGFFLIGVSSPDEQRLEFLIRENVPRDEALRLIARDLGGDTDEGQNTRATFELADAFVPLLEDKKRSKDEVRRVLELLFGNTFHTPSRDEHAMFIAYASSLRSGALSRQVGAVILSEGGEIIATGANDVPAPGGGLYWPGVGDQRDLKKDSDSNDREIDRISKAIASELGLGDEALAKIKGTALSDVTEYGRAVHAEMDAILASARVGATPRRGALFSTTFPCHNCAKHIIAAGISRVVYVEPYPKSHALELHSDAIVLDAKRDKDDPRVLFEPFLGIGPRRFVDLFSLRLSSGSRARRKDSDGNVVPWNSMGAELRVPLLPSSYLEREGAAVHDFAVGFKSKQRGLPFTGESK